MKNPKALEIIKDLLKHIDIVAENFRTGVMERWGMGYADLKKINPEIIMCSASGFGRTGPWKDEPAYAPVIDGFSGYGYVNGYPDGEPAEAGARGFSDSIAAFHGVYAVLAALYHHLKTGEGQYLDLSMTEAELAFAPEAVIEYAINGRVQERWETQISQWHLITPIDALEKISGWPSPFPMTKNGLHYAKPWETQSGLRTANSVMQRAVGLIGTSLTH